MKTWNREYKTRCVKLSSEPGISRGADSSLLSNRDYARHMLRWILPTQKPETVITVVEDHYHKVGRSWVTTKTELGRWAVAELLVEKIEAKVDLRLICDVVVCEEVRGKE